MSASAAPCVAVLRGAGARTCPALLVAWYGDPHVADFRSSFELLRSSRYLQTKSGPKVAPPPSSGEMIAMVWGRAGPLLLFVV